MSAMSPSTTPDSTTLPRWRLFLYALPSLALAALGLPVMVLLPTAYAEDFGLGLSGAALALLAARLVDVASDPLIGWWCDRAKGGRKIWLAFGLPLILFAGWHLFHPDLPATIFGLCLWSVLFSLGITAVTVPYQAWGVDLSRDDHQRSVIASWREGSGLIGVLAAMVTYALSAGDTAERLARFFPPVALILALAFLAAGLLVPEQRKSVAVAASIDHAARPSWFANRSFLRLLLAQSINALANGLPATLFLPFVEHILGRRDAAGPLLLIYFSASILGIPLWWKIGKRMRKDRAWRLSLTLTSLAFLPTLLLGEGDFIAFAVICLLTGIGLAGDLALPAAILAETVHDEAAQTQNSQAGFYVSLWALCGKLGLALAVGVAFPLLSLAGHGSLADGDHTLSLLYAGLPVLLKLLAVWLLAGFFAQPSGITPLPNEVPS